MEKTIALIPGDGIGPDVVAEAVNVLNVVYSGFVVLSIDRKKSM